MRVNIKETKIDISDKIKDYIEEKVAMPETG